MRDVAAIEERAVMTPTQIELARHALGLPNKRRQSYRNHIVKGKGCDDYLEWSAMVEAGVARRREGSPLTGGDDVFWLRSGAEAALASGERLAIEDFPRSHP